MGMFISTPSSVFKKKYMYTPMRNTLPIFKANDSSKQLCVIIPVETKIV